MRELCGVPTPAQYIALPIAEARAAKWLVGRAKHGPLFRDEPALECHEETLDGLNYCDEMERQGYRAVWIGRLLMWLACVWVRLEYRFHKK
jgi:hypothetical protein